MLQTFTARIGARALRMAALGTLAACLAWPAAADDGAARPRLQTNEGYVEDVTAASRLDVTDMRSVLKFVLDSLPDRVVVYPTENYYYFSFYDDGVRWAGNLRLDVETRDDGKIHMTYFKDFTSWQQDEHDYTAVLGAADGVTVEKLGDLVYRVAYGGRSVVFALNDLSGVVPPAGALRADERYLGPVFDESGLRFYLVFNPREKMFLFVLDESVRPADEFYPSTVADGITIGRRTGFALYDDPRADRRVLVGVNAGNTGINNYLDGPFDQLPDNFLEGNALLDAILTVSPHLAGTLDRFGNSADDTVRYLIAPYVQYEFEGELSQFAACVDGAAPAALYACLSPAMGPDDGYGYGDAPEPPGAPAN